MLSPDTAMELQSGQIFIDRSDITCTLPVLEYGKYSTVELGCYKA